MPADLDLDNTGVPVAGGGGKQPPSARKKLLYIALAAGCILALVWILNLTSRHAPAPQGGISGGGIGTVGRAYPQSVPRPKPAVFHPRPAAWIAPHPVIVQQPKVEFAPDPDLDAPITAADAGGSVGAGGGGASGSHGTDPGGAHDALSQALTPSDLGGPLYASMVPHPDYRINPGTLIPCVMETATNSQLMSFFDCEIPVNVPGSTGRVMLMDKNTQVFGYMRGGLAQGQDQAWLLSATAYTPNNVQVPLNSPIADSLGRSGMPLNVDNHWIQILTAAAAYSLISSGPNIAASALQSGNHNNYGYTLIGAGGPIQNVGENAFQREMNLYPTGTAPQGRIVFLFVAHPLDFSKVYKVEAVR